MDTDLTRMARYLVTSTGKAATVSKSSSTSGKIPNNVFTAETLALHNKPGDSYIAYNGIVYDVSNHPSWATGVHHGMPAGVDITSRFPHPVSYLASLPIVGTYVGGTSTASGSNNSNGSNTSDDGQDEDKKYEIEDKEEDNSE
jgi:predicted heme/steroid binding protein